MKYLKVIMSFPKLLPHTFKNDSLKKNPPTYNDTIFKLSFHLYSLIRHPFINICDVY